MSQTRYRPIDHKVFPGSDHCEPLLFRSNHVTLNFSGHVITFQCDMTYYSKLVVFRTNVSQQNNDDCLTYSKNNSTMSLPIRNISKLKFLL